MSKQNNAVSPDWSDKHAVARWEMLVYENLDLDRKVGDLTQDLYYDLKCGYGAAEYNLTKAGMIEMIFGHAAGKYYEGENAWTDGRWTLTKRGRRTSMVNLKHIMLQDPPLEIALADAELEAVDVADNCGGCDSGDEMLLLHKRILDHLIRRVERIAKKRSGAYQ
jgi:hypothetical protein